jgi:hypothetical protein
MQHRGTMIFPSLPPLTLREDERNDAVAAHARWVRIGSPLPRPVDTMMKDELTVVWQNEVVLPWIRTMSAEERLVRCQAVNHLIADIKSSWESVFTCIVGDSSDGFPAAVDEANRHVDWSGLLPHKEELHGNDPVKELVGKFRKNFGNGQLTRYRKDGPTERMKMLMRKSETTLENATIAAKRLDDEIKNSRVYFTRAMALLTEITDITPRNARPAASADSKKRKYEKFVSADEDAVQAAIETTIRDSSPPPITKHADEPDYSLFPIPKKFLSRPNFPDPLATFVGTLPSAEDLYREKLEKGRASRRDSKKLKLSGDSEEKQISSRLGRRSKHDPDYYNPTTLFGNAMRQESARVLSMDARESQLRWGRIWIWSKYRRWVWRTTYIELRKAYCQHETAVQGANEVAPSPSLEYVPILDIETRKILKKEEQCLSTFAFECQYLATTKSAVARVPRNKHYQKDGLTKKHYKGPERTSWKPQPTPSDEEKSLYDKTVSLLPLDATPAQAYQYRAK